MKKRKNILICPLEWGLGHAARMVPLASRLQEMNNNIFIGAGEEHLALFRAELQNITLISFAGFRPGYSRYFPQYLIMLLKTPLLLYHIIREHHRLKTLIRDHEIDIVISDNRFGLWNKNITSVYITHLPRIPMPRIFRILEIIGVLLHRAVIKKYSLCFIPDLPGDLNVSGRLSHGLRLPANVRYTGILSRFMTTNESQALNNFDFQHNTVILSGPQPQREMLRQKLISLLKGQETPSVFLEGKPGSGNEPLTDGKIISYNHLSASEMKKVLTGSRSIISRSGYTTIMDLISLNCSALLIPTPGQTEQEYLARYLSGMGWFCTLNQGEIKHGISLPSTASPWPAEIIEQSNILLRRALTELMDKQHKNE